VFIELFADANFAGGLGTVILIHGRELEAYAALLRTFRSLALAENNEAGLHDVPGVRASGCRVSAVNQRGTWLRPEGIYALEPKGTFRWHRDGEGWLEVADKVESLLRAITAGKSVVFQVLQESRDVTVIMSDTRGW